MSKYIKDFAESSSFNNFLKSAGELTEPHRLGFITQAADAAFLFFDGITARLGRFIPDLKPKSLDEVIKQATESKGAILVTENYGNVLIEISFDRQGYRHFRATDEFLQPLIYQESKEELGSVIWEMQVAQYLNKYITDGTMVEYGPSRLTEAKLAELKKQFAQLGWLSQNGTTVTLKLPGEELLTFQGPFAGQQAEIVLKHFYQWRKTPSEEIAARPWDIAHKALYGYLYISGFVLAPWIQDHVALPHQLASAEDEMANQFALDGFLSEAELAEMAKNPSLCQKVIDIANARESSDLRDQLERISFTSNGYTQTSHFEGTTYEDHHHYTSDKEIHHRKVFGESLYEEYHVEQGEEEIILTKKVAQDTHYEVARKTLTTEWKLVKEEAYREAFVLPGAKGEAENLFLPQRARNFVATTLIAYQNPQHAVNIVAITLLAQKNPQAAMIAALMTFFKKSQAAPVPKITASYTKDQEKVSAIGSILRRQAVTILNPLPDSFADIGYPFTQPINLQTYCQLSDPYLNGEVFVKRADGSPAPSWISMNFGSVSLIKNVNIGSISKMSLNGNYMYLDQNKLILDISDINNPTPVGSWSNPSDFFAGNFFVMGNCVYYAYATGTAVDSKFKFEVINLSNPSNPTVSSNIVLSTTLYNQLAMSGRGNFIYLLAYYQTGFKANISALNVANPSNPIVAGTLTLTNYQYGPTIAMCVTDKYFIYTTFNLGVTTSELKFINVSNPSAMAVAATLPIASGETIISVASNGKALFIVNWAPDKYETRLLIYNIEQISSIFLVKSLFLQYSATGLSSAMINIEGNFVYLSLGPSGVTVVDISDINQSFIVASFRTLGTPFHTQLRNNNVYISDGNAGLGIYNAASRALSGTPGVSDRGLLSLNVIAKDGLGNFAIDPIVLHVGNINVAVPVSDQQVYVGSASMLTLDAGTFEFPNANFTYSAKLSGGMPLPSFISFDSLTRTFIFAPQAGDQNSYTIEVTGNDGYGGTKTTSFVLSVPDRPPTLEQPLGDQVAISLQPFVYIFSSNSFADLDGDILSYSAKLSGTTGLPAWLNFDPVLRKFYGTPYGRGTYVIEVTANDGFGGTATDSFTITVPNTAPIVQNPIGTQLASLGTPYSYPVPTTTFFDLDSDPLTLSAIQMPPFLKFDNVTNTFWGTPQSSDLGSTFITLQAEDTSGAKVSTTFSLTVVSSSNNNPPVVMTTIPDQTESVGIPFSFSFVENTFVDPEGQTLTYQAFLEGGAPLPEGVYFDPDTRTFTGQLAEPQTLKISVKATDPYNAFAIDTFDLNIVNNQKPILLSDLPDVTAEVGVKFTWSLPPNTFEANDQLQITISQAGGKQLPKWLKCNGTKLEGTPGPFDTGLYVDSYIHLEVWGRVADSSTKAPFTIIVQGQSFWETVIKFGFSAASAAGGALALYRNRATIWNYIKRKKDQKKEESAPIGKEYKHVFSVDESKLKKVIAYKDGRPLTQDRMPDGLTYIPGEHQIKGKPTGVDKGRFVIEAIDYDDYLIEHFELIIKDENDPDPVNGESNCLPSMKSKPAPKKNKVDEDESVQSDCLGRKRPSAISMTQLLQDE